MVFIDNNQGNDASGIFLGADSPLTGTVTTPPTTNPSPTIGTSPAATGGSPAPTSSASTGTDPSASTPTSAGPEPELNFSPPPNSGASSGSPANGAAPAAPAAAPSSTGGQVHYAGLSSNPIPGAAPAGGIALADGGLVDDSDQGDPITGALNQAMDTVSQLLTQGRKAAGIQNHGGDDQAPMGPNWGVIPNTSGLMDAPDQGRMIGGSKRPGEIEPTPLHDDASDTGYFNPTATGLPPAQVQGAARGGAISEMSDNASSRLTGYAKGGVVKGYDDGGEVDGDQGVDTDMGTGSQPAAAPQGGVDTGMRPGSPLDLLFSRGQKPAAPQAPPGSDAGVAMAPPGSTPQQGQPMTGMDTSGVAMGPQQDQTQQKIADYLAGKGALPSAALSSLADQVDPNRQLPEHVRHPLVVKYAQDKYGDQGGLAALQSMRQTVVGMSATAAAALDAGNLPAAAQGATEAANYHLDGTAVQFTPLKDGVLAVVQPSQGTPQRIPLTTQQFRQYLLSGPMTLDAANEKGIGAYLTDLSKQQAPATLGAKEKGDLTDYMGPLVAAPGTSGAKVYQNLYNEANRQFPWDEQKRNALYNQLVEQAHGHTSSNKGGLTFEERKALAEQAVQGRQGVANTNAEARRYGSDAATARSHERVQAGQQTSYMRERGLNARQADANARAVIANPAADPQEQEQAKQHVMERFHQAGGEFGQGGEEALGGQPLGASRAVKQATQQYTPTSLPVVQNAQDYAQVQPGKQYRDPQGNVRTKPQQQ